MSKYYKEILPPVGRQNDKAAGMKTKTIKGRHAGLPLQKNKRTSGREIAAANRRGEPMCSPKKNNCEFPSAKVMLKENPALSK